MGKKKLRNKEWEEIHQALIEKDFSIKDIADKYKINRLTLYQKAWKEGWFIKGEKKKGIGSRIGELFKK